MRYFCILALLLLAMGSGACGPVEPPDPQEHAERYILPKVFYFTDTRTGQCFARFVGECTGKCGDVESYTWVPCPTGETAK